MVVIGGGRVRVCEQRVKGLAWFEPPTSKRGGSICIFYGLVQTCNTKREDRGLKAISSQTSKTGVRHTR